MLKIGLYTQKKDIGNNKKLQAKTLFCPKAMQLTAISAISISVTPPCFKGDRFFIKEKLFFAI